MARVFAGGLTRLKGKAGDYYYRRGLDGRTIMAALPRPSEKKPVRSQLHQRAKWGNVVNAWQLLGHQMSFESKPSNRSDYNQFMAINLKSEWPTFGGELVLDKARVEKNRIIPFPYILSQGSLRLENFLEQDEDGGVTMAKTSSSSGGGGFQETLADLVGNGKRVTFIFLTDEVSDRQDVQVYSINLEEPLTDLPPFVAIEGETGNQYYRLAPAKLLGSPEFCVWVIVGDVVESVPKVSNSIFQSSAPLSSFQMVALVTAEDYQGYAEDSYGAVRAYPFLQRDMDEND